MFRRIGLLGPLILLSVSLPQASGQVPDTMKSRDWFRPSPGLMKMMATPVDFIGFRPNTTLKHAFDSLSHRHGLTILVNTQAFKKEGVDDILQLQLSKEPIDRMKKTNLSTILRIIVARIPVRSRATLVISQEWVEITTRRQVWEEYLPAFVEHGIKNIGRLSRGKCSLHDVMDLLSEAANLKAALVDHVIDIPEAKSVRQLLHELKDKDPDIRYAAVEALVEVCRRIGSKSDGHRDLLKTLKEERGVAALIQALKDEDASVRREAAGALGDLGPKGKAAVPALMETLKDEDPWVSSWAARSLGRLGPDAIPPLIVALFDKDEWIYSCAFMAFAEMGTRAKPAIPAFLKNLEHDNPTVRRDAAFLLYTTKTRTQPAIVALRARLTDKDVAVRVQVATTLWELDHDSQATVPVLAEAFKGPYDSMVRSDAALTLRFIGPKARAAIPSLMSGLMDKDPHIRTMAIIALGRIRLEGKLVIPALIATLKDPDKDVRFNAAWSLGDFGLEASSAVGSLIQAMKDEDQSVRIRAISTLENIGPRGKEAIPHLIEALKDPDEQVQRVAEDVLRQIDPDAAKKAIGK